jgi:hypothetical protein
MAMDNNGQGTADPPEPGMPPSPDDVIQKLRELVTDKYMSNDIAAMHVRATALVARLKSLNRDANVATRARKQATSEARLEIDQTNLGLQNLLYEKRHLEREIEKCRQFAYVRVAFMITGTEQDLDPSIRTFLCTLSTNLKVLPLWNFGLTRFWRTNINLCSSA